MFFSLVSDRRSTLHLRKQMPVASWISILSHSNTALQLSSRYPMPVVFLYIFPDAPLQTYISYYALLYNSPLFAISHSLLFREFHYTTSPHLQIRPNANSPANHLSLAQTACLPYYKTLITHSALPGDIQVLGYAFFKPFSLHCSQVSLCNSCITSLPIFHTLTLHYCSIFQHLHF